MITKIGIVAGEIWNYLEKHDQSAAMDEVVEGMEQDRDIILMSIGWLSREGHVILEGQAPNHVVRLTNLKEK